jgi:hypothetical protein
MRGQFGLATELDAARLEGPRPFFAARADQYLGLINLQHHVNIAK